MIAWIADHKAVLVIAALALFLVLERLRPAARPRADTGPAAGRLGWRRLLRNFSFWAANGVASPLVTVPIGLLAASHALGWRAELVPILAQGWPGLLLDLLILDAFTYWWHRANHRLPILWRMHEVHHLDQFLDASAAGRFHPFEVILSACVRGLVVFLLGVEVVSLLLFEALLVVFAIFHHSNLRLPAWLERPLSWIIVTPGLHWVHHHAVRADTDSNFAGILSLWDRVFGTRNPAWRRLDMPIGVEGRTERTVAGLWRRPLEPP